ncbi:MAG: single-stranded DNA-binding protein [Candidatus Veblenbacteria bacterium]|nr:single-stranded DNA-binding protein [Candidatus Veblenbacteria bacterium]MDZ4229918.1 single-stranded DNA-binding protein [Candidatus Veblenbacteria bacterium]
MNYLNRASIIGNVTRDPETKTTAQGTSVTTFSVATNLRWTTQAGERKESTEYHNVVAWRRLAEICAQYIKRGSKVYVEGRLQTRSWDDAQGQKHWRTEIVADNIIMLDRPAGARSNNEDASTAPTGSAAPAEPTEADTLGEQTVEEIPF